MVVTFCGHSDFQKNAEYEKRILDFLENNVGYKEAEMYLGGYGNFDYFAYDCCKKYKTNHNNVTLIFITPYITAEYQKNYLKEINGKYDYIIYPEIEHIPLKFAITYRNKWMIEKSDLVVCAVKRSWGGAYKSYQCAKRKKKTIFNVFENDGIVL